MKTPDQYWEDGYMDAPDGGIWAYGWFGGPNSERGLDLHKRTWFVCIFKKHVFLLGAVPSDVEADVLGKPDAIIPGKDKKVVRGLTGTFLSLWKKVAPEYETEDHAAVFKKNSKRLEDAAQKILRKKK